MAQRRGKPLGDIVTQLVTNRWQNFNTSTVFMPPGNPPPVTSPSKPRTFDYPAFYNLMQTASPGIEPDDDLGLTFNQIREFSENWEIVRLVIETCKDQLAKLRWSWRLKPNPKLTPKQASEQSENDPRVQMLNEFFEYPDKEHDFYQWIRLMMEEILVCDVLPVYIRPTFDGSPYSFNILDCSTLDRKLDEMGLTPDPSEPYPSNIAYQQRIKGQVIAEFTTEEMLYFVRNPRVNKVYGYGGIEQIIPTINTGIRRALMQLFYYTDGNIPAMFMKAPVEWTKEQIREFQAYWNELMSGNLGELSKGWLIPGDADPVFPQKEVLKDDFDEWLARVACYAYSVSPNSFIKNLNRATSEQAREQADEEGLQGRIFLVNNILNRLQRMTWGYKDIEFHLSYDRPQDSKKQAEIDNIDIRNGTKSVDEVRRERGYGPIGAPNRVYTNNGFIPLTEGDKGQFDVFQQRLETVNDESKDSGSDTEE